VITMPYAHDAQKSGDVPPSRRPGLKRSHLLDREVEKEGK